MNTLPHTMSWILRLTSKALATSKTDVFHAWSTLSEEKRRLAEGTFWVALSQAIGYLLEKGESDEVSLGSLDEWRSGFSRLNLVDKEYWVSLVDAAKLIFKPDISAVEVKSKLSKVETDNNYAKFILYLALSVQRDAALNEIASAQAVIYQYALRWKRDSDTLRRGIGARIVRTWRHIASKRGFYLNNPTLFRRILSDVHNLPTDAEVAKVLLAAADAVGIRYDEEVYKALSALATS